MRERGSSLASASLGAPRSFNLIERGGPERVGGAPGRVRKRWAKESSVAGSISSTARLTGLLFGVCAFDPATFIAIVMALAITALLACYLPARRAIKIDPMIAMRRE